jgi:hypothetical protein
VTWFHGLTFTEGVQKWVNGTSTIYNQYERWITPQVDGRVASVAIIRLCSKYVYAKAGLLFVAFAIGLSESMIYIILMF